MREVPCPTCKGTWLRPESLAVTIADRNIAQVAALSVESGRAFFNGLELSDRDAAVAARVLKEINARLGFRRRRPRLPQHRPGVGHPGRRQGPADPAGHPDRLRPDRGPVRARRALHRAALAATTG